MLITLSMLFLAGNQNSQLVTALGCISSHHSFTINTSWETKNLYIGSFMLTRIYPSTNKISFCLHKREQMTIMCMPCIFLGGGGRSAVYDSLSLKLTTFTLIVTDRRWRELERTIGPKVNVFFTDVSISTMYMSTKEPESIIALVKDSLRIWN